MNSVNFELFKTAMIAIFKEQGVSGPYTLHLPIPKKCKKPAALKNVTHLVICL